MGICRKTILIIGVGKIINYYTMKKLFKLLFVFMLVSACSSNDDDGGPTIGGPSNPDEDIENNAGNPDAEVIEGFTYIPTDLPLEVVDYPIGNIVSAQKLASSTADNLLFKDILLAEYSSITAENDMKANNMFLGPDNYDYSDGDAIVAYAKANNLRVHGHVLVWHSQQPSWFSSFAGTDEEFEEAVLNYVTATVAHFAEAKFDNGDPVVAGWDVVNEAFETNAISGVLNQKIPDLVAKCFIAARAGDPDVKLFYNDFNVAGDVTKRNKILDMVEDFQTRDTPVPIDGIGMQMHLNHDWPSDDLPTSIQDITDTGLLVHVSELDVKINYGGESPITLSTTQATNQEVQYQRAAYYYNTLVPEAQQYGITIWGFRDTESWLYNGGRDWPLIHDSDFNYKISHRGFVNGLKGQNPD